MVTHAWTLSVFGRHCRRSDPRAAVVAVRSQRTIITIRRDDAAFRLSGAVSIVVLSTVCVGISDAQLTVTHDDGGGAVCVDSTTEKTVCECAGNDECERDTRIHTHRMSD